MGGPPFKTKGIKPDPDEVPYALPPPAPTREAILTPEETCTWLGISKRQLYRLDLPAIRLGSRTVRYSVEQVLKHLQRKAAA